VGSDAVHITYWGNSGPRVVLVHGSAQGSTVGGDKHFAAQGRLAERGWRLMVPDRPGHGRSPAPGRPDDAQADGAWVSELLADGAHLVGHSFGGCVALAAAVQRPEAVRSLTLIEPAMQALAIDDAHVRRFLFRMVLARMFSLSPAARARRFARLVGIPPDIRSGADSAELTAVGRGLARIKVPSAAVLSDELNRIKQVNMPLLLVTGGWNPAFDATAKRVASLGGGRHRIIAAPHHFPNLVSDEFNDVLEAFMRAAEARSPAQPGWIDDAEPSARQATMPAGEEKR
jgi:pimeloyl-ACP methyl ester carboxylesterase